MQCTFCGTENRPEYKFCAMCGVRLERRNAERRVRQGASTKCASCGHLSETGLKFCGMCGARTERRMQERRDSESDQVRAAAIANAQLPTPEAHKSARVGRASSVATAVDLPQAGVRRGEPALFRNEPVNESPISGPSFLGLNSPPEGDGEYLLEDEPSRGGLRKVLLLVIIVAILGLIFMQWRSSFKASPKAVPSKVEPGATPAGENRPPSSATTDGAGKDAIASTNANDGPPSAKDSANGDGESTAENPLASVVPSAAAAPSTVPPEADEPDTTDSGNAKQTADAKAAAEPHTSDTKPSAALARAQQYLQGRGVPQNCEQGMLYLKAANDKGDPGAAIQMAALYTSGHCVKQDRVMAYRWFNSAHELEPANMWIQKNMDQLWAQMTSQERRLAGY